MTVDIIITDRLALRSALDSDLDTLHSITFSDPEVMSQAFSGKPLNKKESKNFFSIYFDHGRNGKQLGVRTLKDTNTIIGFSGLLECSILGRKDYEIGFVLGREYWGKGYASEIGDAQIKYGIELLGCKRLLALVAPKNKPSISVLHKIGMVLHSTVETKTRGTKDVYIVEKPS